MTIRQVLLDGAGASGDGTTWNDLSDATSAYIGQVGFDAAVTASVAGDTVFVKGVDSTALELRITAPTGTAQIKNQVDIIGCKSATTNNQGAIVTSDLIPGQRTGAPDLDTGSISLAVGSATTITRASGDFTADNFVVGQVINSRGFGIAGNNGEFKLSGVSPGTLTIDEGLLTAEAAGAGRSITAKVYAYDDPDMPTMAFTGGFVVYASFNMYGVKIDTTAAITIHATGVLVNTNFEECWLECGSSQTFAMAGAVVSDGVTMRNTRIVMPGTGGRMFPGLSGRRIKILGGEFSKGGGAFMQGSSPSGVVVGGDFSGVRFYGGATILVDYSFLRDEVVLNRCKFPANYALVSGTPTYDCQVENYGSDSNSGGINTSEQNFEVAGLAGALALETTKVRTGGATDNAAGDFSVAMNASAGDTSRGKFSLKYKLPWVWVEGDGTPKTATFFFTSDAGNINTANWAADQVWVSWDYPSSAGDSRRREINTVGNLAAAPVDAGADVVSIWGAGTARNQKIVTSIDPFYQGFLVATANFAPGANGETIYAGPKLEVT